MSSVAPEVLRHAVGHTHWHLGGPASGPLVVLVNGATLPLGVWQPLREPLHARGFRTLCFDLSGRGGSSRLAIPDGLEADLFQVRELLVRVVPDEPVHLVGLASGALVVARFVHEAPTKVRSATLIAPDGVQTRFQLGERLLMLPGIGEVLFGAFGRRSLMARVPRYSSRPATQAFVRALLTSALQGPTYRRAVLAYVRALPLHAGESLYEDIGPGRVPVHVLWGAADEITPARAADWFRARFGPGAVTVLEGVGHLPHVEAPEQVAELLSTRWRLV